MWKRYKLAAEVEELRKKHESASAQLERLTSLSRMMVAELKKARAERDIARQNLEVLGGLSVLDLQMRQQGLEEEIIAQAARLKREKAEADAALDEIQRQLKNARESIVETADIAILQEVGIYEYRHPLTDIVAYEETLFDIQSRIKAMTKKDGGAVISATNWTVNGSESQGRTMVREFSKLMLRAFNAEADSLVRGLKPYRLAAAMDRLKKSSEVIARLGKTMSIRAPRTMTCSAHSLASGAAHSRLRE